MSAYCTGTTVQGRACRQRVARVGGVCGRCENRGQAGFGGGSISQLRQLSEVGKKSAALDPLSAGPAEAVTASPALHPGEFNIGEPVRSVGPERIHGHVAANTGGGTYNIETSDGETIEVHRTRLIRPCDHHPDFADAVATMRAEAAGSRPAGASDQAISRIAADTGNDEHATLLAVMEHANLRD